MCLVHVTSVAFKVAKHGVDHGWVVWAVRVLQKVFAAPPRRVSDARPRRQRGHLEQAQHAHRHAPKAARVVGPEEEAGQDGAHIDHEKQEHDDVGHRLQASDETRNDDLKLGHALDESQQANEAQHP